MGSPPRTWWLIEAKGPILTKPRVKPWELKNARPSQAEGLLHLPKALFAIPIPL
jgi:hypothetical protein